MNLPIVRISGGLAWLLTAISLHAQTGPPNPAEQALSTLEMRVTDTGREFRAVAPFHDGEFLAASFDLDGEATTAALHRVAADGTIGAPIRLSKPPNYTGSRVDRLIPVGDAMIAIGHVAAGPEDRRGWIIRIERDFSVSAQTVLPIAFNTQPVNYYYGGVLDDRGRLVVAGRSDQPDLPGIGIRFDLLTNGLFRIGMAFPNGPASIAGVMAGDILIRANGQDLQGLTPQQILDQTKGDIDTPLQITVVRDGVGERQFTIKRAMVKGVTTGVVAVLDPRTLDVIEAPKLVVHSTSRAGLQDIGRMRDGQLVGVGWWEGIGPDGRTFDKAWIVALDSNLNVRIDQQFGLDGDNSIAHRIDRQPDGRVLVIGGMNAAPEPFAFASELTLGSRATNAAELTPLHEHHEGPGGTDVFRGITTLGNGSRIVAGAFRSDDDPRHRAKAMMVGGDAAPRVLFSECQQSYVWDMASTETNSIAIAGYCIDQQRNRLAALMWSPPVEIASGNLALSDATRLHLDPAGDGQSFDLADAETVLVFVPAGTPGVLSLSDASGGLVDFTAVDLTRAGLLEADLDPGRYVVKWSAEGGATLPRIDVMKAALVAPEPGSDDQYDLDPESRKALSLLGYHAAAQQDHALPGTQTMAVTRDIAAFQLSLGLPALGRMDIKTEVALSVAGALQAERTGTDTAARAVHLARSDGTQTLASRFGPVTGHWRGDMFVGHAQINSLEYAGEWQLDDSGQVRPGGFGRLENRNSPETSTGMFRNGVFSGLGVTETVRGSETRHVGVFDDLGRFTKGAVFIDGTLVSSGVYAPDGRTLLRDVPVAH